MRKRVDRLALAALLVCGTAAPARAADAPVTHVDAASGFPAAAAGAQDPAPPDLPIPSRWCGDVGVTDDTEHEYGPRDAPKFKVALFLVGGQDFDPEIAHLLQDHVRLMIDFVGRESGGRKSIRFDLGTRCGPGYVDLAVLRGPASGECPALEDMKSAVRTVGGTRNFLSFFRHERCGIGGGYAEAPLDDQPGPGNAANDGGRMAVNRGDERPLVALHEVAHTLGAVQPLAPHSDVYFHCWDHADVMCYPYTQELPQSALRPCEWSPPLDHFDCNKDDYFNPEPPPGSYLDTHWNLYDSVFMCPLPGCTPPPAAPEAPPAAAPPPPAPAPAAPAPAAERSAPAAPKSKARRGRRCAKRSRGQSRRATKKCRRAARRRSRG